MSIALITFCVAFLLTLVLACLGRRGHRRPRNDHEPQLTWPSTFRQIWIRAPGRMALGGKRRVRGVGRTFHETPARPGRRAARTVLVDRRQYLPFGPVGLLGQGVSAWLGARPIATAAVNAIASPGVVLEGRLLAGRAFSYVVASWPARLSRRVRNRPLRRRATLVQTTICHRECAEDQERDHCHRSDHSNER